MPRTTPKAVLTIVLDNGARATFRDDGTIKKVQSPWCKVEGCNRPRRVRGLCNPHYRRWQIDGCTGSAEIRPQRRWATKADDITYPTAHARVLLSRGPATTYHCQACGAWASDWAYAGGDPQELTAMVSGSGAFKGRTTPVAYSPNGEYYVPLCRSCHVKHDRWKQDVIDAVS